MDKILEFADYQRTHANQRQIVWQKFQDQCVLVHNGSLFQVTAELLAVISSIKEPEQWILDMNSIPVWIEDIDSFYQQAYNIYYTALNDYGNTYNQLKNQRSVKTLMDL
jgi:hypothetical protein